MDLSDKFKRDFEDELLVFKVAEMEKWRVWIHKIPFIEFPAGWRVKPIPPFGGAVARFQVMVGEEHVSVYLDCYDRLGYFGEPYWEVYPYHNDVGRCAMNDTKTLLEMIADRSSSTSDSEGQP